MNVLFQMSFSFRCVEFDLQYSIKFANMYRRTSFDRKNVFK